MSGKHLYIIQSRVTGAVKVGRSDDPELRLRALQVGSPHTLRIILIAPEQGHLEIPTHHTLHDYRTRHADGEWFHEPGLGLVPDAIWAQVSAWYLENPDWWKT